MPAHNDSVDKIVQRYFSVVTTESFVYKKKTYHPKPARVSAHIFVKRMTCVAKCGACCSKFTLDYIPCEVERATHALVLQSRIVEFNDREVKVYSDIQDDNPTRTCRFLNMLDGRCKIHQSHPFSCDFEPIRFYEFQDQPNRIDNRPFGRAWNMTRIDGEKGALCEWYEQNCDEEWKQELIRKFKRLQEWTDYFGLKTTLPCIIEWIASGPHTKDLFVGPSEKKGFELL